MDKEPTDPCNPPFVRPQQKQTQSCEEEGFQGASATKNLGSLVDGHTLSNRLSVANQTNPTELNTGLWSALPHELLARVCLFGDALRYRRGQFVSQIRQTDPRVVLLRPMMHHMQQYRVFMVLDDLVHYTVVTLVSLQDAQNTHTPSIIYTFTYRHKPGEPDAHRVTLRKIDTTIPVQHDHPPIYHVKYFLLDANNRWFRQMLYVQ